MRALLVDDSRTMRRIVAGMLGDLGYEVAQAGNGEEALDVLRGGFVPDLVCIDWNMPRMDGLELVTAIRANTAWNAMTLMMMTSQVEQEQVIRALTAGAQEYLMKPFNAEALRDKLAQLGLFPEEVAR
jgi:two-component system chemotaxis response regulator CheY